MNPEKAADYLTRVNWKSFIEWMTAEAILNRPHDPLQFCRYELTMQEIKYLKSICQRFAWRENC